MATEESGSASLVPSQALPNSGGNPGSRRRPRRRGRPRKKGGGQDKDERPPGDSHDETKQKVAKPKGRRDRNTNVRGHIQDEKPPAGDSKDESKEGAKPKRRRNRGKRKKFPWRRYIPPGSVDPITLDPLVSLPYPPFALAANEPYVPVPEWPVPADSTDETEEKEPDKMTPEERHRRIMEEQWGQAVAALPEGEQDDDQAETPKTPTHYNLFDGRSLAYFLVSTQQYIDPMNRRDLTREELLNLDSYLQRHGFTDLKVVDAYDAKGVTLSTAGALGNTAAGRAAILQQEAQVLLGAMFGGLHPPPRQQGGTTNVLQQQYAASQRQQQQQMSTVRNRRPMEDVGIYGREGMVIIDDDANPGLRGRGIYDLAASAPMEEAVMPLTSAVPNTLWSASHITQNYSHSARGQAHNFPSLPTPSASQTEEPGTTQKEASVGKGPSRSLQRITKVVAPTNPAEVQRQKEAREEAQRRAALANLAFGAEVPDSATMSVPGQISFQQAQQGPTEGQLLRNQAMASALGVEPATVRRQLSAGWARPTEGALDEFGSELNAATYPDSLIVEARERMNELLKLERKWKTFLQDDTSASLPLKPMNRELRTFVHEYSDFWKLHTESFDREPKRYIHCVKLRDTSAPTPLLSDVARNWRGPTIESLPRGPRETTSDHASKQTAGQATVSREFPSAPPREPLKLKPRSVPISPAPTSDNVDSSSEAKVDDDDDDTEQLSSRFNSLFTGRERPKLELAPRTVPLELPPYQPTKAYNVAEERERQQAAIAEKVRREREEAERKAKILAYAFASSDEEDSARSSEWEEAEEQFSGSDEEDSA